MRFRPHCAFALLAVAALTNPLRAQKHVAGFIGGFSTSPYVVKAGFSGLLLPDVGVSSTVEFDNILSVGAEARFVRKRAVDAGLDLDYVETPLFVRIALADKPSAPF